MRAGPKAAVDASPLPFLSSVSGSARFADFCRQFPVTYNPLLAGFGTVVPTWTLPSTSSYAPATSPMLA
ncbi:MAG: hypothetical protein M3Q82_09725 [Actinomycetota bacterium]|nr:hypothetical protein [Actinomycetota bacterium]